MNNQGNVGLMTSGQAFMLICTVFFIAILFHLGNKPKGRLIAGLSLYSLIFFIILVLQKWTFDFYQEGFSNISLIVFFLFINILYFYFVIIRKIDKLLSYIYLYKKVKGHLREKKKVFPHELCTIWGVKPEVFNKLYYLKKPHGSDERDEAIPYPIVDDEFLNDSALMSLLERNSRQIRKKLNS